jgi:hypothetical protein
MENELRLFVGNKFDYYFPKWQQIEFGKKSKTSLNIYALFFSLPWISYRKFTPAIFIYAFLTSILLVVQNLIKSFYPESNDVQDILKYYLPIIPGIILGLYGNYWYYLFSQHQISKLKIKYLSEDILKKKLEKNGNPSIIFLFINVGLFFVLLMLILGFWELLFQLFFGLSVLTV